MAGFRRLTLWMRKVQDVRGVICPMSRSYKAFIRSSMHDCPASLLPLLLAYAAQGGHMIVGIVKGCYLVDPASSHMLVSKIKPCMCKYELTQTVKLRMAH